MAKTHRKKINRSPGTIFGRHTSAAVLDQGSLIHTSGMRSDPNLTKGSKDAKPVHVGRVYTGVPKGKFYPYRSEKRGGISSRSVAEQALDEHNAKLAERNAQVSVTDPA